MGVLDFFGREAGQRRTAALEEFGRSAEEYVPPELRPIVGLLSQMTPTAANERAAMASDRLFQPDRTVGQRVGDFGEMASEIAGVVAPVAVAGRAGMPAAEALQEALMGFSAGSQQAGRAVVDRLNQPGPVPTMYSNPLMGGGTSAPRNEAEAMAQKVLEMRAAGRAREVTDDMMAAADDQYMYFNTPIPMDEASRMARAGEIGHNVERDLYRGGGSDRKSFSADAGTFKTQNTGVFMDPNPMRAETYAKQRGGVVAPLLSRSDAPIVSGDMSEWNRLEVPSYAYDPVSDVDIPLIEQGVTTTTDDIARAARQRNLAAIEIQDVMDPGPMRWRNEDGSIRDYPQFGTTRVEFDPANIRSRFARFDPEFRHLRNLSAGVGGLGLLGMSYPQEEQY